jgi:glucokinase
MKSGRKRSHSHVSSHAKTRVLAIDLGGSKISGAIVDSDLSLLAQKSIPSRETVEGIADPQLSRTKILITELCAQAVRDGIDLAFGCVGVPEYVNLAGFLTTADNVDWQVQPQEDFALLTGFPWVAQSDVRCAGIAEAQQGAGQGESNFVYVTISSGISHTHFLEGRAVTGPQGEAIGFGLTEVEISGQSHVLENYCSGLGIARRYAKVVGDYSLDAKSLMERFEIDTNAREMISTACEVLGVELAKLADQLSTSVIVAGGGLWLGSAQYRGLVLQSFEKFCRVLNVRPSIRNAEVEHSGVVGAAIYALAQLAQLD